MFYCMNYYTGEVEYKADTLKECESWCYGIAAAENWGMCRRWMETDCPVIDCGPRVYKILGGKY